MAGTAISLVYIYNDIANKKIRQQGVLYKETQLIVRSNIDIVIVTGLF